MRLLSSKSLLLAWALVFACDPGSKFPPDSKGTGGTGSGTPAPTAGRSPLWDLPSEPPGKVSMTPPKAGELDPFEQNAALGRGINIGNALDAPSEGSWGVTLMPYMFESIEAAGFDSVRLPVKWSAHALTEAPYTIDKKFFDRVDWAVAHALTRKLKIVVDMHHYGNTGEEGIYDQPLKHHERFLSLWKQIAEHYKDYPKELYLEVLNEPRGALESQWNAYMGEAVAVIREYNPGRTLIVGGGEWNKYYKLSNLTFPDDNIIATFHYYNPYCFSHMGQGQFWESICKTPDGSDPKLAGNPEWPVIWPELDSNPEATETRARALIESDMQTAATWSEANNRPLYMGEFGVSTLPSIDMRADYTSSIVKAAVKHGFSFAYWQYTSEMGMWDAAKMEFMPKMLKALQATPDAAAGGAAGGSAGGAASGNSSAGAAAGDMGGSSSQGTSAGTSAGGTTSSS